MSAGNTRPSGPELMAQLRGVLNGMTDSQLAEIGVTIERDDDSWILLRDIMVDSLDEAGRRRAATTLREHGLYRHPYSVGITADLLRRMHVRIKRHYALSADQSKPVPITDEMVEAGMDGLDAWASEDVTPQEVVRAVLKAALQAEQSHGGEG